jgi:glyoxylase I family protein
MDADAEDHSTTIAVRGLAPLLAVFDMAKSIHFYHDVLGFEIVSTSASEPGGPFGLALLRLNGAELMLNTAYDDGERPPNPDPARIAAHIDTCIYLGCPDVDTAYAHLCAHQVEVKPPAIAYYGMKQLYVTDPDGFNLCFQWPATERIYHEWVERYRLEPE